MRTGGLQPGDGVYVTDSHGCRIKADVAHLTSDSLTLTHGRETLRFHASEMLQVERQDSVWNGIAIGLGAGALTARRLLGSGSDSLSAVVSTFVLVFGGGALIGWAVDANVHETVYQAPRTAWKFEPLAMKDGAGARLSVVW